MASMLRTIALLFMALTLGVAQAGAETVNPQPGIDYAPIVPPVPSPAGKPEVVEVFNFKCPHCFDLHSHIEAWLKNNGDRYQYRSLPVFWGRQTDLPLRLFFAAEFLGHGPQMKGAIFKAQFVTNMNIENINEVGFIAEDAGLDPEKLKAQLQSFGVSTKVSQALSLQKAYGVTGTPTLVVNGKYLVSFGSHAKGDAKRLLAIVEALASR
ncbi:MAG: DSBA oxidoreductase [Magnetococcales bacterium]|nr:DSBA oxidoreductase [Magnetococcales bacterium]HIJ83528.1 thiol:disulfide interchange protein DsbA/DsbL [Magnetococcales bacterium]